MLRAASIYSRDIGSPKHEIIRGGPTACATCAISLSLSQCSSASVVGGVGVGGAVLRFSFLFFVARGQGGATAQPPGFEKYPLDGLIRCLSESICACMSLSLSLCVTRSIEDWFVRSVRAKTRKGRPVRGGKRRSEVCVLPKQLWPRKKGRGVRWGRWNKGGCA